MRRAAPAPPRGGPWRSAGPAGRRREPRPAAGRGGGGGVDVLGDQRQAIEPGGRVAARPRWRARRVLHHLEDRLAHAEERLALGARRGWPLAQAAEVQARLAKRRHGAIEVRAEGHHVVEAHAPLGWARRRRLGGRSRPLGGQPVQLGRPRSCSGPAHDPPAGVRARQPQRPCRSAPVLRPRRSRLPPRGGSARQRQLGEGGAGVGGHRCFCLWLHRLAGRGASVAAWPESERVPGPFTFGAAAGGAGPPCRPRRARGHYPIGLAAPAGLSGFARLTFTDCRLRRPAAGCDPSRAIARHFWPSAAGPGGRHRADAPRDGAGDAGSPSDRRPREAPGALRRTRAPWRARPRPRPAPGLALRTVGRQAAPVQRCWHRPPLRWQRSWLRCRPCPARASPPAAAPPPRPIDPSTRA